MCSSLLERQSPGVGTLRRLQRWPRRPGRQASQSEQVPTSDIRSNRHAKYDLATISAVKRRTVSLTDDALEALDRIAKEHRSTVSGVVEAAGRLLREGGPGADDLKRRLVPDRRGGDRRPKQQGA